MLQFQMFFSEALCDRFSSGLHSTNIQKWLLLEEELTCAGVLQMAQSVQTNTKNCKEVRHQVLITVAL